MTLSRKFEGALRAGGQDNRAPRLRPIHGADYYAAFIIDPDAYRIEANYGPGEKVRTAHVWPVRLSSDEEIKLVFSIPRHRASPRLRLET